ncbi:MAG TPA: SDR family oxidoreductase [bacterium]|nr:SDR family oxidoreductase [bacterium]
MPQRPLADKVAIVTGGGRGLGRAMALGLAAAGAHVVVTAARHEQEINQVSEAARRLSDAGTVLPIVADVTREEDCGRAVEAALGSFGALHIVVNNAGRGMRFVSETFMEAPTRFWEVDGRIWRLIIETNVIGPFLMAKAVVPHFLGQRWGRIINVSINHETMRRKGFSPYGPSKAALESETIIWAQDLAGTGVTVNALLPGGATQTGMVPETVGEEVRRRLLDPAIVVPPLLWLASEASDGVTGSRVVASAWDPALPPSEAAARARAVAGWAPSG